MAALLDILDGLAAALEPLKDQITNLQIEPRLNLNPTAPSLDMYPGSPFAEGLSFNPEAGDYRFIVRARVETADMDSGFSTLMRLMDHMTATSVAAALEDDETLGGTVDSLAVTQPAALNFYAHPSGQGSLLGTEWEVRVIT
jgi:hypothetical protein